MNTAATALSAANALTDAQLRAYREDGWCVVGKILDAQRIAAIAARFSELVAACDARGDHPALGPGIVQYEKAFDAARADVAARELGVRKFFHLAPGDAFFRALVCDDAIAGPVRAVLGQGIQLLQAMALVKPPEIGVAKDWHQDIPYFPLDRTDECAGVWIALDDATPENGCMQFLSGSHRAGPAAHVQGPTGWRLPDDAVADAQRRALLVPVPAGTAILFDANTWHFTDHNRSAKRRRAFQAHFVSARTRRIAEPSDARQALWRLP